MSYIVVHNGGSTNLFERCQQTADVYHVITISNRALFLVGSEIFWDESIIPLMIDWHLPDCGAVMMVDFPEMPCFSEARHGLARR